MLRSNKPRKGIYRGILTLICCSSVLPLSGCAKDSYLTQSQSKSYKAVNSSLRKAQPALSTAAGDQGVLAVIALDTVGKPKIVKLSRGVTPLLTAVGMWQSGERPCDSPTSASVAVFYASAMTPIAPQYFTCQQLFGQAKDAVMYTEFLSTTQARLASINDLIASNALQTDLRLNQLGVRIDQNVIVDQNQNVTLKRTIDGTGATAEQLTLLSRTVAELSKSIRNNNEQIIGTLTKLNDDVALIAEKAK